MDSVLESLLDGMREAAEALMEGKTYEQAIDAAMEIESVPVKNFTIGYIIGCWETYYNVG